MSRPLVGRLLAAITLGQITLVDDTTATQQLQVSEILPGADGSASVTDKVARLAQFGFASSPPRGSDVLVFRLFGNRGLTIAVATGHQASRLKNLQPGDSALHDVRGAKLYLGPAGPVLDAAGGPITIQNFSTCTVMGDLHVTGDVIADSAGQPVSLVAHVHGLTGGPDTTVPIPG